MVVTETSFPRGGVIQKKPKDTSLNFGAITKPKPRKEKPNKRQREVNRLEKQQDAVQARQPKSIEAISAELLSIKTLREGMIVLGCVKSIGQTSIEVALPGRMNGTVTVAAISQTYLSLAQKYIENEANDTKSANDDDGEYQPLSNLFTIGQVVCVKIIKVDASKTGKIYIELSMQPKDIHADFQHQSIAADMIMCVAIAERQEHGYVLETGVNNLRGFLPQTSNDLQVGGVYLCRVKSSTNAATASTATFELANSPKLRTVEFVEPNVNHILPGMLVKFAVTKVLKDGLQGTIFNGTLMAYINEHQLGVTEQHVPRQTKNFETGAKMTARILYVMPLTKIVYLTLNLKNQFKVSAADGTAQEKILPIGTIVEKAIVSHIGTGGIVLKLQNAKGVISLRSLKGDIKANFDVETLLGKYEPNSVHKVRVLFYNPMDLLHICSVDPKILNEKHFVASDVNAGDFVNAKIQRKLEDGRYAIQVGCIKGYIHPMYISKSTVPAQLQPERQLKCRILCKSQVKDEIFVTNLKDYMDDQAPILTASSRLSVDQIFLGVVKLCQSNSWLIEFCDYIVGGLYRNQMTANELSAAERFCVGQTVRVTIKSVKMEKSKRMITLGLADYLTNIGGRLSGKISGIHETGIDVAFMEQNLNGFIPMMYLSDFPSLVHALHRAYKCNNAIEAIGVAQNCYSIRDVTNLSGQPTVVKTFDNLQIGDVIPAVIKNVTDQIIDVHCLIKDYRTTVPIHLKMFVENYAKANDVTLIPDQKLYVRIMAQNTKLKTLTCSARLDDVWPGSFKHTVEMMHRYFNDIAEIQKRLPSKNPFKSYCIGQVVEGHLIKSDRKDSDGRPLRTFTLDGDVKLYVTKNNDATQKNNEKHRILIVWIDYSKEILWGTMLPKYLERAETKQDEENAPQQLLKHHGLKANVLLILDDVIVVYPIKWTNRFIYIPTRVHYNDFQPIVPTGLAEGSQANVSMIDVNGAHFIGMPHNLYEIYLRKIDQKLEFIKLEQKDEPKSVAVKGIKKNQAKKLRQAKGRDDGGEVEENATDSTEPSKKHKTNAKKRKSTETQPEIKIECDDLAPKQNKKRSSEHIKSDFEEKIEIKTENDANKCEPKTPPSKKKRTLTPAKSTTNSESNDVSVSKKQRKSEDSSQKTAQNSSTKKTPRKQNAPKSPTVKRFSMRLSQLDGAIDLDEEDKTDRGAKQRKLPGVSNFWSTDLNVLNEDKEAHGDDTDSSSDDGDEGDAAKGRKLTSNERFEKARVEEARIRAIEKSLAEDSILPTSIDQFDRLVMAEPNNSRAWINYMVFHVQASEIDRARGVGKKALKTIDVREQQERLNIWVALLNMELRFGSKDAFDEVLKEALLVNEPFNVYAVCMKIFADCKRVQELSDMVLTVTKKFRQNPDCWLNAAQAIFDVNLNEKAKALLNRALNSLPERDHINMISRFALLCNKYDEKNHAHALFEQILVSYPKRVDCWSQYIDILIKANDIDIARQTLERAVIHKIPMKKMRTLFKKYLDFEQKYGNDETVAKVKALAANYVHNEINS